MTDRTHPTYEMRRRNRVSLHDLKRRIVFGLGVSSLLTVLGALHYYLVLDAWDPFWKTVMGTGGVGFLLTVVFPDAWYWPERGLRRCTSAVGHFVLMVLLTTIYFTLVWPAGFLLRKRHQGNPIHVWNTHPPPNWSGWCASPAQPDGNAVRDRRRAGLLALQPLVVVGFFIRRRKFLLLPVLVLFIILGLVFFFVQTSVLAPFIYTLF